jgi:serine/threonine-protein kinase
MVAKDDDDKTKALGPGQSSTGPGQAGEADQLKPGTIAGAYVLKKELASGGGGTVYEAQHRLLGRRTAVKVLRRELAASPQMVARFLREALAVNVIKHPNIVDIYEFGELPDGRPFYVMELLDGVDVRSLLVERGRFTPKEVYEILEPVCSALQAAHDQGIVHRDLKASNILVMQRDGKQVVKLLDFGIAKLMHPDAADAGLTVVGTRLGTSYTMAPEQIRGDAVDPRTDIYALGVVLYHLLTGQYPFRAETMSDIERLHLEAPPPRPSKIAAIPPAIDTITLRCMEKAKDRRFPSVTAFIEALREAIGIKKAGGDVSARAAAIYVEIRVAEGADAESDEVLDDTSMILDTAEQAFRGAGLVLPLQTGSALIGARVLSSDPKESTDQRHQLTALAKHLAEELESRSTAHAGVHVNISMHVDKAAIKDSAEAPGGKEIIGGDLLSIADWAPQENVSGVHFTAAARR